MRPETSDASPRPLRHGYTTGACATAASLGAALALDGRPCSRVTIRLPRGQRVAFELLRLEPHRDGYEAAVRKDAGDDPDVTHGAVIYARVRPSGRSGIHFRAAPGVGVVTRPGLPVPVGEPAINPVPRRMMTEHLQPFLAPHRPGLEVAIGVEDGEALARRTLNPRLGIRGGLSILGTTGIVRPYSCSAYIASIQQAIDVARANGCEHLLACTGATSERAARALYPHLPELALIEMGDFVGAVIKHLRRHPVARLSVVAGFAKLCKLAQGRLDLHSRHGPVDLAALAQWARAGGASAAQAQAIAQAPTALAALEAAAPWPLAAEVSRRAVHQLRHRLPELPWLEAVAVDRQGRVLARSTA